MSVVRHHGEPNIFGGYLKTASTALTKDSVVAFSSGELVAVTSGTLAKAIAGIIQRDVVSTDSDYASAVPVDVEVPRFRQDYFTVDIGAGKTLAQSNVGTFCDFVDALTIDPATNAHSHVLIEAVLNTTGGANGTGQALVSFPSLLSA